MVENKGAKVIKNIVPLHNYLKNVTILFNY